MIRTAILLSAAALSLTACNRAQAPENFADNSGIDHGDANAAAGTAAAEAVPLRMADGKQVGTVAMRGDPHGVTLTVNATAIPAGTYGMHVHEFGKCEGPKFESAGAHWNPAGKQHGKDNPAGAHMGDLDNLVVGANGRGGATISLTGTSLNAGTLLDADGAAVVVHAKPDDYKTDPSGNSGDRIACAVLGPQS